MKAVRLVAPRAPLELQDVPVPEPGDDEVLIEVAGCGVCHTDIGFWKDGVDTRHALPLTLGHEIAGRVVQAGSDFAHLEGREVIVPSVIPCGSCDLCRKGRGNACRAQLMPGNDMDGGFADFVRTPGRGLCVVDERNGYDLADLSVIADAVTTPYQGIVRSGLGEGDLAVVVGVGGVGTYAVQIAAALGARVVAVDVNVGRLSAVAEHGADLTLNGATQDLREMRRLIREAAGSWGCPAHGWKIFECSGHPQGQETAFGLLGHAATLVVIGFTLAKIELRLSNLMAFDATAMGTWGCLPELYPEALKLVTDGRVKLWPFIERHPLTEGPAVLQRVADHAVGGRAILIP